MITKHAKEIEAIITGNSLPVVISTDATVEDTTQFALENHLEDFLVKNWQYTELGKKYDIYQEDGEIAGQQYPSDTGPIDILAISKDKKELLVVELKKGRVSDNVVGQIQALCKRSGLKMARQLKGLSLLQKMIFVSKEHCL